MANNTIVIDRDDKLKQLFKERTGYACNITFALPKRSVVLVDTLQLITSHKIDM